MKQFQSVPCSRCGQPLPAGRDEAAIITYCHSCELPSGAVAQGDERVSMRRNAEGKLVYVRD